MAAGARGRGVQGGASRRRSPRDGGGGSAGEGGRNRNGEGRTSSDSGTETRTTVTAATTAMTAQVSRRRGQHYEVSSKGEGGEYCTKGGAEGESADESAGWSGKDSDGAATDEDMMTAEAEGREGELRTETAGGDTGKRRGRAFR